jgi:hypothetical protein
MPLANQAACGETRVSELAGFETRADWNLGLILRQRLPFPSWDEHQSILGRQNFLKTIRETITVATDRSGKLKNLGDA